MNNRKLQTAQELRANNAIQHDHEIADLLGHTLMVRPKRINLPTTNSDKPFSTKYHDNSWKRHRQTQYRSTLIGV